MYPLLIIGLYLVTTWAGVVIAKVFMYHRPRLSANSSCFFNWLLLFLMFLGIPWLILFRLIGQDNWVNQLLLYFQLRRLTIYPPEAVQELFNTWKQHHALAFPEVSIKDGFEREVTENMRWLSTRQVLLDYAYAKPVSSTHTRTGMEYLQTQHPDSNQPYFSGKVCLVRTNKGQFGVYSESYEMY